MNDSSTSPMAAFYAESSNPDCAPLTAARDPAARGYTGRFKRYHGVPTVPLPAPRLPSRSLGDAIEGRLSCRQFRDAPVSLEALSTTLHGTLGVLGRVTLLDAPHVERPIPSGGARYPLELYVIARRVEGLGRGLYHYAPRRHALEAMRGPLPWSGVVRLFLGQSWLERCAAMVVLTGVAPRTMRRYGARGYRFLWIEAGHAAQNLGLLAGAQGLGALCLAGFHDRQLAALLDVDVDVEPPLYAIGVGCPVSQDRSQARRTP